jgi:hypothetical protein
MLPQVEFAGLNVTRLIIGANPFGGYSHQNEQRDEAMRSYYTVDRILETWDRAEKAGINTFVTNNETPHILQAVREYVAAKGRLQWIAQINCMHKPSMFDAIDEAVAIGCKAVYFHGELVDNAHLRKDAVTLRSWCTHARQAGILVGAAGHVPETHLWVNTLEAVDFHCVPFFNCGSLHSGKGHRFQLSAMAPATDAIRHIRKPCIGYKIMGAGRIDARLAFEYAFERIKPGDAVNVGMHRGDNDNMVAENAALVKEILSR